MADHAAGGWGVRLLAIDPGTHLGWAVSYDGRVESGVEDFSLARGESPGMRFIRFNAWLAEMCGSAKPEIILYEQPHLRGGAATDVLVGITTRIDEACALRGIEHASVHSSTLKKSATGHGNADKGTMLAAANVRWAETLGRAIHSDDEADALHLLAHGIKKYGQEEK